MVTDILAFIKCTYIEELSTDQHHSHIINSIYKIQLLLDVLQLIDKSIQSKVVSLLTDMNVHVFSEIFLTLSAMNSI